MNITPNARSRLWWKRQKSHAVMDVVCNCGLMHATGFFCDAAKADRFDPTGTLSLRRAFAREIDRRWRMVKTAVNTTIRDQDVFAFSPASIINAQVISTEGGRLKAFQTWFDAILGMHVYGADRGSWTQDFIVPAYKYGVNRALRLTNSSVRDAGWDPDKHPRHPGGSEQGGEFSPSGGGGLQVNSGPSSKFRSGADPKAHEVQLVGEKGTVHYRGELTEEKNNLWGVGFIENVSREHKGLAAQLYKEMARYAEEHGGKLVGGMNINRLSKAVLEKLQAEGFAKKVKVGERELFEIHSKKIHDAFTYDAHEGREQLLVSATVSEIQGVMEAVSQQAVRSINAVLISGSTPREAARLVNDIIDNVGSIRGRAVASVMVVHAHATGTLDTFESLGVKRVGIEPESNKFLRTGDSLTQDAQRRKKRPTAHQQGLFERRERKLGKLSMVSVETAGDDKVCPICEDIAQEGPYSIDAARGLIPAHPSCRCAFVPSDEDEGD